jgi:hypothetical protein
VGAAATEVAACPKRIIISSPALRTTGHAETDDANALARHSRINPSEDSISLRDRCASAVWPRSHIDPHPVDRSGVAKARSLEPEVTLMGSHHHRAAPALEPFFCRPVTMHIPL